ncbi:hypothetical protein QEP16_10950 [Achromobacter insolitus]|nr:hypothetical protein [Achromobacter insolitus]MDH3063825.1 hypothetical protein [Achromobacter insolitus]
MNAPHEARNRKRILPALEGLIGLLRDEDTPQQNAARGIRPSRQQDRRM